MVKELLKRQEGLQEEEVPQRVAVELRRARDANSKGMPPLVFGVGYFLEVKPRAMANLFAITCTDLSCEVMQGRRLDDGG